MIVNWRALIVLLPLAGFAPAEAAPGEESKLAATFYVAQTSTEEGWEDVFINPAGAEYTNDYLAVAGLSRKYARYYEGALQLEMEGQVAYHFGRQENWEFNAIPVMARWRQFPWSHVLATSAAFGLGLSYTTQLPELEVELEGESQRTLIYWVAELTAGLPERPWAVSLRLHHRSVGYGLMGDEGGMNAVGLGLRWQF
jgi:phytoene dehydrogenase-like protein